MMGNIICELLNIKYPIIQGAMASITDAGLVGAVSNAGGIGVHAAGVGQVDIDLLRQRIKAIKQTTDKPFGVNVMLASPSCEQVIELLCRERTPFVTTGAGDPSKYIKQLKAADITVAAVVPSGQAAVKMQAAGVDFLIAEGMESGGFIGRIATMALLPQVADAVQIPVVAAGGIADGRGMAAAFMLGAQGVQLGTRFLATKECILPEIYKQALLQATANDAVTFGDRIGARGRMRGLNSSTIAQELLAYEDKPDASLQEFQKILIKAVENVPQTNFEQAILAAGQCVGLLKDLPSVQGVIDKMMEQFNSLKKPEL
jgi:enoyl-[acyl-carrier protein] reductase II